MMLEDFRFEPSAPRLEVEGYCFEVRVLDCEPCVLVDAIVDFCGFASANSVMKALRRNTQDFSSYICPRRFGIQYVPLRLLVRSLQRSHSICARWLAKEPLGYLRSYRQQSLAEASRLQTQILELETDISRFETEISRRKTQVLKLKDEISRFQYETY